MESSIFWDITLCGLLLATRFHAGFLLGLFFDAEDGGDMFLRNTGLLSMDYTVLNPKTELFIAHYVQFLHLLIS
jgi:hypothetical protein